MKGLKEIIENLNDCKGWDDEDDIAINEAIDMLRYLGAELHGAENSLLTQASLISDLVRRKKDLEHQNELFKKNLSL